VEHRVAGWASEFIKDVIVDREAREIQVVWERIFDESSAATIEQFTLRKIRPFKVPDSAYYGLYRKDYVTISFDPPIVKQEGERLTLNGVFKTKINI